MAQDDSRWQDLLKMQEGANASTNPSQDQPSGQFSGDDIEFEAFMFDPGTGPLAALSKTPTDPALGFSTAANTLAAELAAPHPGAQMAHTGTETAVQTPAQPAPVGLSGGDVPLPPFLTGTESQPQAPQLQQFQQPQTSEPYEPMQSPRTGGTGPLAAPRGTGPLSLGSQNASTNLAARLSQLQGSDTAPGTAPRGTGPLGMRRGTGPLGGVPGAGATDFPSTPVSPITPAGSTEGAPETADDYTTSQPAAQGPINPAYFKTPTGPLGQRIRTGPLGQADLHPEPEQTPPASVHSTPTFDTLSSYPEHTQSDPTTWSDTALSSVEDFSQILLALSGLPSNLPPMTFQAPAMSAGTAVQEERTGSTGTTQEWAGLPFENAYSASSGPALAEPPAEVEEATVPGWGEMTGAPPESSYTTAYDEVAAPTYDGPQLDYLVPLEEVETQATPAEQYAEASTPATEEAQEGELQFEGFMFDEGHPSQVLSEAMVETQEPETEAANAGAYLQEPMAPVGMDSFLQPRDEFDADAPLFGTPTGYEDVEALAQIAEIAQYEADAIAEPSLTESMEAPTQEQEQEQEQAEAPDEAEDDAGRGPLPFWLQDTADLERVARQGYVDMGQGTPAEEATADEMLAMHTAEPIAPPEVMQAEEEVPTYAAEPAYEGVSELQPATEEDFADVEAFDVAPFDVSMLAPQVETEAPVGMVEPTYEAEEAVEDEPQMELEAEPAMEVEAQAADEDAAPGEFDYEELPPIEPFDFAALNLAPEEEEFGFNTQELLGVLPDAKDRMRATANLDVLADIFDGAPIGSADDMTSSYNAAASVETAPTPRGVQRPSTTPALSQLTSPIAAYLEPSDEITEPAPQAQLQQQLRAEMDIQATQPATQEEPEVEPVQPTRPRQTKQPAPPQQEGQTGRLGGGWTSAVTTALSMEGLDDFDDYNMTDTTGTGALETGMLADASTAEPAAEPASAPEGDFEIEPFDFRQLNLEEEQEIPTGMLDPRRARRPGGTGDLIAPDRGGSLWTERPAAPAEEPEDDEESWRGTERDTSLFMSTSPRLVDRSKSTGWLTDDATVDQPVKPAPTTRPKPATPATPAAAKSEQPAAEAPTEGRQGKPRKKTGLLGETTGENDVVKARVTWADETEPALPTLPTDFNLPTLTTGPLTPEVEDIEATVPQAPRPSKQTRGLTPRQEPVAEAPAAEPEATTRKGRTKPAAPPEEAATPAPAPTPVAAQAATPAATPAPEPVAEPVPQPEPEPAQAAVPAPAPVVEPEPAPPATPAMPEYTYQPMQSTQSTQTTQATENAAPLDMPKVGAGRSMYTSGPLPELEGFEALRQLVEENPDDIGAHMALAAGYSQLGDLNTTLRVYRRVLRKRNIPQMFLSLIAEELNDYEREMQDNPHYHQVRGDLYMKQGRHQEAIGEYNKIR